MKKSLFDISDDMLAIRELFDNFDGDVSDEEVAELIDKLFVASQENEEEFDRKIDSYIWLIKELKNDAAGRKAESVRLAALAKRDETHADALEDRLQYIFKKLGLKDRKTKYHHPKFVMPGGKQSIEYDFTGYTPDPEKAGESVLLDPCYVKTIYDVNKDAVREELENGGTLPFARLKEKEPYLRIK